MISYKIIDDTYPGRPQYNRHTRLLESNQPRDIAILRKEGLLNKLIVYRDSGMKRKDKLMSLMLFYSADKIEGFSDLSEEDKRAKCKEDVAKKLRINQKGGLKYKKFFDEYSGAIIDNVLENGTYRVIIVTSQIFAQNPNLVPEREKAATSKKQASPTAPQPSKSNPTASSRNFAFSNNTEASVIYKISDLPVMATAASTLLRDVKKRIDYFKIKLDTPINLNYQSRTINGLSNAVDSILSNSFKSNEYNSQDYVKISFNAKTFEFVRFLLVKGRPDGGYEPRGKPLTEAQKVSVLGYFEKSSTTNSIVYNLSKIYNKYNSRIKVEGSNAHMPGTLFYSADSVRSFLNSYIHPKTSIATSEVTRDLVQRFIIGDIRMLDDEFFKSYQVSREQFNDSIKAEMQTEISKQYEAIGDMLGDAWLTGKFEEINTMDDFYESLLNYISIPDLISLSAKCLLKLIPLEDLLDYMCEKVLEKFDEHKEAIIQELDSMEDGVAKDLATELKEIYFNRILGEQLEQNLAQGLVEETFSNAGKLIQEANVIYSWQYKGPLNILIGDFIRDREMAIKVRGGSFLGMQNIETTPASSLENRKQQTMERVEELKKEQAKLNQQLQVFQGQNVPENLQRLKTYYADEIKRLGNAPGGRLEKLNRVIENSNNLVELYKILLEVVVPCLVVLDPYLDEEERKEIEAEYLENTSIGSFPEKEDAISALNAVTIPDEIRFKYGVEIQENPFNFSNGYLASSLSERKIQFDLSINNGVKAMYEITRKISFSDEFESPGDYLTQLEDFGVKMLDETINQLFADETKRYYLCLAIYSAVPAVGYLIYLLFTQFDEVEEFFEQQYETIKKAFSRRIELFMPANFPILDILKEIGEQLKQIGINLARDLIINGVMYVMRQLADLCSDEEKTNAPFNPIGAIDLSEFMENTKINAAGETITDLEDTKCFSEISALDPTFSIKELSAVLSIYSKNFTINEMSSMLNGFAKESLYQKAVDLLKSLAPDVISENSNFYNYYSNTQGIRELMIIIAKDIDPSMIARAKKEFSDQKATLLDICFGNNDDILASTFEGLTDEDVIKALAANNAARLDLIPSLLDITNALFQPTSTTPCDSGEGILSEAQKFTARELGKSIFENAERRTEVAIDSVKNSFLDTRQAINDYRSIYSSIGKEPTATNTFELVKNNQNVLKKFQKKNKYVGKRIRSELKDDVRSFGFYQPGDFGQDEPIVFEYKKQGINKVINFSFVDNELKFQYSIIQEKNNLDDDTPENIIGNIASYSKKQYFDEQIFTDTSPEQILFKQTTGVINQPEIDTEIKNALSQVLLQTPVINNFLDDSLQTTYVTLLNSIFEDIFNFTFETGLFLRENFTKLNLKKHITKTTQLDQDVCFLGFMNSEVLTIQTINLAEKLKCYAPNSATKTPVNVAFIKVMFDAFIRSVALQEMMKSFFVFGIFPRDLIGDQITPTSNSIYEQIIKIETVQAFEKAFNAPSFPYSTFYDEVFRTFILDITRVIFQNQELTEEQAYSFSINSQIQFIKDQFKKAFFNAFGNSDSIMGQTEYQLLQEQLPNQQLTEENNALFNINDSEIAYSEKLRVLQNDRLANFYDIIKDGAPTTVLFGGDTIAYEPANEDGFQLAPVTLNFNSKMPVSAIPKPGKLTADQTKSGNGLILDKFVEINLKQTAFTQQQKQFFELTLIFLGKGITNCILEGSEAGEFSEENVDVATAGMPPLKKLKMLFYETKLFMFFPQAISFIDSLSEKFYIPASGSNYPLYKQYVDEFGNFNLFYWVFRMNYEENFFNDQASLSWYNQMVSSGLWNKLNLGLTGKIRLSDFTLLTDKFLYPSSDVSLGSNAFLDQEKIYEEKKPEPIDEYTYSTNLFNNALTSYAPRLKEFYDLVGTSYSGKFNDFFALNLDKPLPIFDNQNLFAWIYFKKINDLFDITTTIRLDLKLMPDSAGSINIFPFTNNFAQQLFAGSDSNQAKNQRSLLKEKIGPEIVLSSNGQLLGRGSFKFSTPMYELKTGFPSNVSWYDFFINIDKESFFNDDEFYDISEDLVNDATSINSFLFSNNKKDIFSYLNKLKVYSTTSQKQFSVLNKFQFLSTYWWNINGRAYALEDIISAIYGAQELPGNLNPEEVLSSLTENSKASFTIPYSELPGPYAPMSGDVNEYLMLYKLNLTERKKLFEDPAEAAIAKQETTEAYDSITYAATTAFPELMSDDSGFSPFIEFKEENSLGWYNSFDENGAILNEKFPGANFKETLISFDTTTPRYQPRGPTGAGEPILSVIPGWVQGGLVSSTIEAIEKPISSSKINIYDLFSKMLKDPEDKKIFNRLLQSLFLVEQTTIVALLHKIYTEQFYPQIDTSFNPLIQRCLSDLLASIAAVNGDYQHTSRSKGNVLTADEFAEAAGDIAMGLLKSFLGAIANTVDPTWKTPWLLPGPFTPFGIAAKLLEEDFDEDKEDVTDTKEKPPAELVCEDSLKQSTDFFSNFMEAYKETFSGENNN